MKRHHRFDRAKLNPQNWDSARKATLVSGVIAAVGIAFAPRIIEFPPVEWFVLTTCLFVVLREPAKCCGNPNEKGNRSGGSNPQMDARREVIDVPEHDPEQEANVDERKSAPKNHDCEVSSTKMRWPEEGQPRQSGGKRNGDRDKSVHLNTPSGLGIAKMAELSTAGNISLPAAPAERSAQGEAA